MVVSQENPLVLEGVPGYRINDILIDNNGGKYVATARFGRWTAHHHDWSWIYHVQVIPRPYTRDVLGKGAEHTAASIYMWQKKKKSPFLETNGHTPQVIRTVQYFAPTCSHRYEECLHGECLYVYPIPHTARYIMG